MFLKILDEIVMLNVNDLILALVKIFGLSLANNTPIRKKKKRMHGCGGGCACAFLRCYFK